jgi:hypothetical protein
MRVNVYAEEMTERIEIVEKVINGVTFTGLRMYMYLPVTLKAGTKEESQLSGPFIHNTEIDKDTGQYEADDDSAAITFWGKQDLRDVLWKAIDILSQHYQRREENESSKRTDPYNDPGPRV